MNHRKDLFVAGEFTSNAGLLLPWKVECDALSEEEIDLFASIIGQRLAPYSEAIGIPRGGLRLAERLNYYDHWRGGERILLVDDVVTTGGSFQRFLREKNFSLGDVSCACMFNRGGFRPSWLYSVWEVGR